MNKKKTVAWIVSICLVLTIGIIVFQTTKQNESAEMIPSEISAVVETYMEAYKDGTENSAEYAHFEDEFIRTAYIASGDKLLDYKIESAEKINNSLYCFSILVKTEQTPYYSDDEYELVYNFVTLIHGKWYFLNGISHIPSENQDNLDKSKYQYNKENSVDSGDVIQEISTRD